MVNKGRQGRKIVKLTFLNALDLPKMSVENWQQQISQKEDRCRFCYF